MCKFLIEQGAEVDEIAPSVWDLEPQPSYRYVSCYSAALSIVLRYLLSIGCRATPLCHELNDDEKDDELLHRINECRRHLLLAGADPAIGNDEGNDSVSCQIQTGTPVSGMSLYLPLNKLTVQGFVKDHFGPWTTIH